MSDLVSRRQFIIAGAGSCAAACAGCGGDGSGGSTTDPIGDPSYYPDSSRPPSAPMDTAMPQCGTTTGLLAGPMASAVSVNQAALVSGRIYVCRDSNGVFALDLTCTHASCQPGLSADSGIWVCPCHNSQFAFDGSLLKGPATRPLPRYYVCKGADGKLYVDTTKKI
jgi:cytochrome b6-f complex iron-sulfur subunit